MPAGARRASTTSDANRIALKPAFNVVAQRLRGGALPTAAEVGAMLAEARADPAEAAALVGQYAAALPVESVPSGEASVLDALRSFTLRH